MKNVTESDADAQTQILLEAVNEIKENLNEIHANLDVAEDMKIDIDVTAMTQELNRIYGTIARLSSSVLRDAFLTLYAPVSARLSRFSVTRC